MTEFSEPRRTQEALRAQRSEDALKAEYNARVRFARDEYDSAVAWKQKYGVGVGAQWEAHWQEVVDAAHKKLLTALAS